MSINLRALGSVIRPPATKFLKSKSYSSEAGFVPPKRIPRSPTDVLRALANTVGKDPTAPHYKYHDDPYLIPYSNPSKRSYSLSQEAGRKAAQWIRQEHGDLFQHKEADPMIETYAPKPVYNEDTNVNEEILKNIIHSASVSDALTIYQLLVQKNQEVSLGTKLSLLELLCYYNGEDPLEEDWIEERWYRQSHQKRNQITKNIWKGQPPINELFQELSESEFKSSAYCALISGMFDHGQIDDGWKLYEKSREAGVALNVDTYNAILAKTGFMRENHTLTMELAQSLVVEMNQQGLEPNLGTLNALLKVQSASGSNKPTMAYALKIFAEFQRLKIDPSPASYYYLIHTFFKNRDDLRAIMTDICDRLQGKRLQVRDTDDTLFFLKSMDIACGVLRDKELAYKINEILHFEDNYNLIGDSFKESNYYRNFFTLICGAEPFEVLLEYYNKLVPNVYIPEPAVTYEILNAAHAQMAWEHLPRLWSDLVLFDQAERMQLPEKTLEVAKDCTDEKFYEDMVRVGWSVWEKMEALIEKKRTGIEWTGAMLGNLLTILLKLDELSRAHLVFDKLTKSQEVLGEPQIEAIQLYLEACLKNDSSDSAIKCVKYCHEIGFAEAGAFAKKVDSSLKLSESQKERLISIVGPQCLGGEKTPN